MAENQPGVAPVANESKGLAIASLITGLLALVLLLVYLFSLASAVLLYVSLVLGVVGLILGILALRKKQSRGIALTGLITGALSALVGVAVIIFALVFVGAFLAESPYA